MNVSDKINDSNDPGDFADLDSSGISEAAVYSRLAKQVRAMIKGVPYLIANLANVSAVLKQELDRINWVGFYLMEDGKLVLGPFQGQAACIEIPMGKGVCGTAAARNETMLVKDVHEFPGHIACDAVSRSEIVVPVRGKGEVVAVLDIDSPVVGRFTEADRNGLEGIAEILEELWN